MNRLLACLLVAAAASPAGAQTVWRCGADGRVYSDTPCAEGRVVAVADIRSDAEVRAARQVAARDRALANELTRQRHEREREIVAERGSGLAGIVTPAKAELKPMSTKKKPSKKRRPEGADTFRAIAPVSPGVPG